MANEHDGQIRVGGLSAQRVRDLPRIVRRTGPPADNDRVHAVPCALESGDGRLKGPATLTDAFGKSAGDQVDAQRLPAWYAGRHRGVRLVRESQQPVGAVDLWSVAGLVVRQHRAKNLAEPRPAIGMNQIPTARRNAPETVPFEEGGFRAAAAAR